MSESTTIEWCDRSWSPWEGCTKVSPGCANCYAETRNHRFGGDNWGKGKPRRLTADSGWEKPLQWNREAAESGKRITVFPSLCDWLDEEVPADLLADFIGVIPETPNLTWLLLSKRPENWENALAAATEHLHPEGNIASVWIEGSYPPNVWVGTSVEDQRRDHRIRDLLKIPAAGKFLSVEPLLGPVDLKLNRNGHTLQRTIGEDIHWVIVGGESGPGARPCNVDWIRDIVRQCKAANVPCFVKQLGSRPVYTAAGIEFLSQDGLDNVRANWSDPKWFIPWNSSHNGAPKITHPKGGDPSEWPDDLRVREFPKGLR